MKLLIDMNLSPRWSDYFALNGIEARHWSTVGTPNAPDAEIMAYATLYGFAVFTHDLSAILAVTQAEKPSVIQVRGDNLSPENLGGIVIEGLTRCRDELSAGALVTIDTQRMRLRFLPLRPKT
ncbi:MAG: DUF5615 family PIN-like protein [Asticcacaulis sp.]|nr:DUF5615 family PIN-like protein [Asticcacaulis sp.]